MRFIALAVMIAGACSSARYGTYLVVEGDSHISFDRVDFYFGDYLQGRDVPTSPQHLAPVTGAQYLHTRIYDPLDGQKLAGVQSSFTYYLPASGGNLDLTQSSPTYVMVVATRSGTPVGIGEQTGFALADSEVDRYVIHLEAFSPATAEVWGQGTPDCVRWEHQRDMDPPGQPSTSAVVREHDKDCDGYLDSVDCNRFAYCDPTDTSGSAGCRVMDPCIAMDGCALGTCTQIGPPGDNARQECTATTCLLAAACSASCAASTSVDDRLQCALMQDSYAEMVIPLNPDHQLCHDPYMFMVPTGAGCANPTVVYPLGGKEPDGFIVDVMAGTPNCEISLSPPAFGDPTFSNDEDVVLAFDDVQASFTRTTFAFTIKPGDNSTGACLQPPEFTPKGPGVATCQ